MTHPAHRFSFAFLAITFWLTSDVKAESVSASVAVGAKYCTQVSFPPWIRPKHFDAWNGGFGFHIGLADFEFRQLEGSEGGEIFISAYIEYHKVRYPSPSHYAFRFDNSKSVRAISDREWDLGEPLLPFRFAAGDRFHIEGPGLRLPDGRLLPRHGKGWTEYSIIGPALISPDDIYVALLGRDDSHDVFHPIQNVRGGRYYTDVYEVQSGTRIIGIKGSFQTIAEDKFQQRSLWLKKRYFILPLSFEGMRRILVCDVKAADDAATRTRARKR